MAIRKPIVLTLGQLEQLQSTDSIPNTIKQTEVDFGTTPISEAIFIITDADVTVSSRIIAKVAYEAPTGKDLDEIEMDDLVIHCSNGAGIFNMYIRSADGSYLSDKFKINYLIN